MLQPQRPCNSDYDDHIEQQAARHADEPAKIRALSAHDSANSPTPKNLWCKPLPHAGKQSGKRPCENAAICTFDGHELKGESPHLRRGHTGLGMLNHFRRVLSAATVATNGGISNS